MRSDLLSPVFWAQEIVIKLIMCCIENIVGQLVFKAWYSWKYFLDFAPTSYIERKKCIKHCQFWRLQVVVLRVWAYPRSWYIFPWVKIILSFELIAIFIDFLVCSHLCPRLIHVFKSFCNTITTVHFKRKRWCGRTLRLQA